MSSPPSSSCPNFSIHGARAESTMLALVSVWVSLPNCKAFGSLNFFQDLEEQTSWVRTLGFLQPWLSPQSVLSFPG